MTSPATSSATPPAPRSPRWALYAKGRSRIWLDDQSWWLGIAEFKALQLGTWLGTTDGKVIAQAVESVTPPFYRTDVELLVAALQHAATLQQQEGQQAAGRFALGAIGVAGVVALAIASSGSGRAA